MNEMNDNVNEKNNVHMTLATELLHELKASAKRWFIAFCIMIVLEVATIAGFLWYISLPVETYNTATQTMDNITGEEVNQDLDIHDN